MKTRLTLLLIGLCLSTVAWSHSTSKSSMFEFNNSGNVPAENDYSTLIRKKNSVTYSVHTSGLDAASPHTVWAVIFNNPQYCKSSPCSEADLEVAPGHDPRVRNSLVWAGGGVSDADGTLTVFGAMSVVKDSARRSRDISFGSGLLNARKAEIHFIVREHGQPGNAVDLFSSISSYGGGCNENNMVQPTPCADIQGSIHQPKD